jgi:chromate transporter
MLNMKPDNQTVDATEAADAANAADTAGLADPTDLPELVLPTDLPAASPAGSSTAPTNASRTAPPTSSPVIPSRREIFLAFLKIGVVAFGGALPWVRRVIVDEKQWLTESEFTEIITVCQAVPGPNVVNTAVFFGTRCRGVSGGLVAFLGLIGLPLVILFALNHLYHLYADLPQVKSAMNGMGIVATAYLVAMAFKMGKPFRHKRWAVALCLLAAVLSAYFHWPMAMVLLSCGAVGVALSKKGVL